MITGVGVVIPAADEQDEIAHTLRSVLAACQELEQRTALATHVVVVLDACTDGTAGLVAQFPKVDAVVSSARCVGSARRLGAAHVLASAAGTTGLWLASTDADCRVPVDWLVRMVAQAELGADLVLGTVVPSAGLTQQVHDAWHAAHHHAEDHPHIHGANLGISAAMYAEVGGWQELPVHEDVDLVQRALMSGARVCRSGAIAVITSSRLVGRAPDGFAAHLRNLQQAESSHVA